MKRIMICFVVSLSFCYPLFSQTGDLKEPPNKIKAIIAKKGSVLIKNFSTIGSLNGNNGAKVELSEAVVYEPEKESESIRGLKIEVSENSRYEKSHSSFLDIDEVDAFVKAIYYVYTTSTRWKGYTKDYTEVMYSTMDDCKIGFYQKGTEQTFYMISGSIDKTSCLMNFNDFVTFLQIAGKSKSILLQK